MKRGKSKMSKTIKQIADEIGVSKQAVHQKRKSKELSTNLQPFTSIVDGVVYISVDGERLIKSAFKKNENQTVKDTFTETERKGVDNEFSVKFTLETLAKQLEEKDKQIDKLHAENEKLINSLENMTQSLKGAQALHAGTMQKELLAENINSVPEEKKEAVFDTVNEEPIIIETERLGFFKKLFGKN